MSLWVYPLLWRYSRLLSTWRPMLSTVDRGMGFLPDWKNFSMSEPNLVMITNLDKPSLIRILSINNDAPEPLALDHSGAAAMEPW